MELDDGKLPLRNALQSPPIDFQKTIPVTHLVGKTVLITGGASGIGAAISQHLAHHGANIIIGDIDIDQGTKLVAELRVSSSSSHHHFIELDVSNWDSQVSFFKTAKSLSPHNGIDCVIANAGINDNTESEELEINIPKYSATNHPPPPKLKTLQVDLVGVLYTSTLALSYLVENPGSKKCSLPSTSSKRDRHLLLVSSIAGLTALPASSVYTASKHGVVGLFRGLRISAPILHGVRVNMLCPQYVDTQILGTRGKGILLGVAKTTMNDVIEATTRLVSDQGVVGRALLVGTRASEEQIERAGLGDTDGRDGKGAIWDVYGQDFEQVDTLVKRTVALLNIASYAKGWSDIVADWIGFITAILLGGWHNFKMLWR